MNIDPFLVVVSLPLLFAIYMKLRYRKAHTWSYYKLTEAVDELQRAKIALCLGTIVGVVILVVSEVVFG